MIVILNAAADPPASPPPCDVELDRVFCARMTWIEADIADPEADRFFFQGELVNWTSSDAHGLVLVLNRGGMAVGPDPNDQRPFFCGAFLDSDGRPLDGQQMFPVPPAGCENPPNLSFPARPPRLVGGGTPNDWTTTQSAQTIIRFTVGANGTPVPAPTANVNGTEFKGLLDPDFAMASQQDCVTALLTMIPGSVATGSNPTRIEIPDRETIDDGPNALDGFTIVIDDFDPGEEFSINWFLIGANGLPIGQRTMNGDAVQGDDYGFGTFNTFRFPPPGGRQATPTALWDQDESGQGRVNTAYDPVDSTVDDSPVNFAEEQVGGMDLFPINPIPPAIPGSGAHFAVEQGAAVTAPPSMMGQGFGGSNLNGPRVLPAFPPPPIIPLIDDLGIAIAFVVLLLVAGVQISKRLG